MDKEVLIERIFDFIKRTTIMVEHLPNTKVSVVISNQILRSATSIGANYRTAYLAKSRPDFINKLKIVEEETDETLYWLELIGRCQLLEEMKLAELKKECRELLLIFIASIKTSKMNKNIKT
ncbi:MAG: four helix bundle protein [Bacteroidetes bacterium]|nr:four helix bundle protein [Bacteroidota bacterium]